MDGAFGAGRYAYPYYGYGHGWTPGSTYQDLPFEASEVEQSGPRTQ